MPKEKSAGAIIFRREDGKIYYLVLRYIPGHWEFARGHVEKGESEEETVKREVFEETGLKDIKLLPGFREYSKFFFRQYRKNVTEADRKKGKTPWVFKLVIYYLAETKTKQISLSKENTAFLWLPIDEAIKRTTHKNAKALLAKANEFVLSRKSL